MAPIWTIFGPIESQRHDLFLKKKSNERDERKVFGNLKTFEKKFEFLFRMIFRSLYYRPRFNFDSTGMTIFDAAGVTAFDTTRLSKRCVIQGCVIKKRGLPLEPD